MLLKVSQVPPFISLYQAISNSIQAFEHCQRQNILTFLKIKESIEFIGIRSLVEVSKTHLQFYSSDRSKRQALALMKYLLDNTFYQTFPQSILDVDAFGLLVTLLSTVPSIFYQDEHDNFFTPLGNSFELN